MCGRYDRTYSPSDVDLYCGQFVGLSGRNGSANAQRYHACRVETEDGSKRCESICGLFERELDEIDDELQFDTPEAAEEAGLPRCGLCTESGIFDDSSDRD